MPWKMVWVPPKVNEDIPVLKELPPGITEFPSVAGTRAALGRTADGEYHRYQHCRNCDGWIEGDSEIATEHTLGPLSGRSGTVYLCRRCGHEIGFTGVVS